MFTIMKCMSNISGNSDCCERWPLEINLQATAHSLTKLCCGNEPLSLSCLRAPSCKAFTGRLRSPSCQGCRSRFRAACSQGLMSCFQASLYGVDTTSLKMSSLFDNPSSVCCKYTAALGLLQPMPSVLRNISSTSGRASSTSTRSLGQPAGHMHAPQSPMVKNI